jgi:hypothetical protein
MNRNSPKEALASPISNAVNKNELLSSSSKREEQTAAVKFNYQSEFENFKKKNKPIDPSSYKLDYLKESNLQEAEQFSRENISSEVSLSFEYARNSTLLEPISSLFKDFERRVVERLDRMEDRITILEKAREAERESSRMFKARVVSQMETEQMRGNSPKSSYYNESLNESAWESSIAEIESNLEDKVRASIIN